MMSGGVEQVIVNRPNMCHSLTWRVSAVVQTEQSASGEEVKSRGELQSEFQYPPRQTGALMERRD